MSSSLFLFSNSFFGEDQKRQFFHGDSQVHKKRAEPLKEDPDGKENRGTGFAITVENSSSQKYQFFKGKILIIKSVFKLFKQHELGLTFKSAKKLAQLLLLSKNYLTSPYLTYLCLLSCQVSQKLD